MKVYTSTHLISSGSPWLLMVVYGILLVKCALIVSRRNTHSILVQLEYIRARYITWLHVDPAHLSRCSSMNYTRPTITRKYSRGFNLYTDDSPLEPRFRTEIRSILQKTDEPLVPKPVRGDPLSPRPDNVDRVYHYYTGLEASAYVLGLI